MTMGVDEKVAIVGIYSTIIRLFEQRASTSMNGPIGEEEGYNLAKSAQNG